MDPSSVVVKKTVRTEALQAYISEYVFRVLTLPKYQSVAKTMPLRVSSSIDFFLGDSFDTFACKTNKPESFSRCTVRGPRTHNKYTILLTGRFVSFTIRFKPAGLYRFLGVPANLFCDQAIEGRSLYPGLFDEITERLMACQNITECIHLVEPYLLQKLVKQPRIFPSKAIDQMTDLILLDKAPATISRFLKTVNLSTRQLERNFIKEIGTTPKLYSNMVRFANLLRNKIDFPEKKWTTLTYEYNYYDQMHLIKNFQRFLGINPGDFIPENFAL